MIDGLIGGKLHGRPVQRTSQSGKRFVTAKVRAGMGEGDSIFVNVITFAGTVCDTLMVLDDGDSVSLAGALTPKVWTPPGGDPRPSLDMMAHAVTTPYHVSRKRKAVTKQPEAAATQQQQGRRVASGDGLDSDLPWDE